jgi:hypothetical protein
VINQKVLRTDKCMDRIVKKTTYDEVDAAGVCTNKI